MTVRAVSKQKRRGRLVTCGACDGRMESVSVTGFSRDGEPMKGQRLVHVPCSTCNSSGKTKRQMTGCSCCNGPAADRCPGCANAARSGQQVHWCAKSTEDEIAFETEMQFAPSPGTVRSDAGRNHPAADLGTGPRAPR